MRVETHIFIMYPTAYDRSDLSAALRTLRSGGIILYPTDTVWGIGCDATNSEAVSRIFALKRRADSKAMLVLLDSASRLTRYATVPDVAWDLLDAASEGASRPLTIIYPEARNVASSLIAEDGSLGVRVTGEAFSRALCAGLQRPLVSTSANVSGQAAAKRFDEISEEIRQGVDYVCRYRQDDTEDHLPSSIMKLGADGTFTIIRP